MNNVETFSGHSTSNSNPSVTTMRGDLLLIVVLGVFFLKKSLGKPTEMANPDALLDPVAITANSASEIAATREQRSPQFGLLRNYYGDYSDYDDNAPYFPHGNKRKYYQHKPYHRPHGCRRYGCGGGWQPDYGNHYTGQGASFASASAGSISGGGLYGGGQSGAQAQSASFNIGPFSASFSASQASSGYNGF